MRSRARGVVALGLLASGALFSAATGAGIIQLVDPSEFGPGILTNDFETEKNTAWVTFDPSAERRLASLVVGGNTPSGQWGLTEFPFDEPLQATLTDPATEVGMWFGNDQANIANDVFDAILEVFDVADVSLGEVRVEANLNDFADQFIGLRSSDPFARVALSFQRPQAGNLGIYIDDFSVNRGQLAAPEPGTAALLGLGVLGLALRRRHRDAA